MDWGIHMNLNNLKNKPLGFQIWIIIIVFMAFMAVLVSVTTVATINSSGIVKVDIFNRVLLGNLTKLIICIIIVSIIIAKVIANTISEPIRYLERKVRLIANKEWIKDIELDRRDEIGRLAYSIGKMQSNLEKLDKDEAFFLQSLSHELKTPIMVLKNYCQALRDEIYINNSYEDTINVIEDEVNILGERIGKLLYISSLEYVLEKEKTLQMINLKTMIDRLVERICKPVERIDIHLNLEEICILGIEEKIQVAIENILENCVRYALTYIRIEVHPLKDEENLLIEIANDGNAIEEHVMEQLFNKFYKGLNGNFGLGLYITKRIVEFHGGHIHVENEDGEVVFKLLLPLKNA